MQRIANSSAMLWTSLKNCPFSFGRHPNECPSFWTSRRSVILNVLHTSSVANSTTLVSHSVDCKSESYFFCACQLQGYILFRCLLMKNRSQEKSDCIKIGGAACVIKFATFFALNIAKNVFCVCEQVATTLQNPSISVQTVLSSIKALTNNLQQQRANFPLTY